MIAIELRVAAYLLGCYALFLAAMLGVALMRGFAWRRRTAETAALVPKIREELVRYLSGSNDQTALREFLKTHRQDVADAILSFQATIGGSGRDRLCEMALSFGLVHDWCQDAHSKDVVARRTAYTRLAFVCGNEPCRRVAGDMLLLALKDRDREVSIAAASGAARSDEIAEVEQVLEMAVSQSLLVRIVVAESLRRHAAALCEKAVPEILASADTRRVLAALEILIAWERAIPLMNLRPLLDHPDRRIRLQALRLAPLVPASPENRAAILHALADSDPELSTVAALSAGRLKIEESLPSLARCLRTGTAEQARSAAAALADIPPRGWETLAELSASSNPVTAACASAALTRARQRLGFK